MDRKYAKDRSSVARSKILIIRISYEYNNYFRNERLITEGNCIV